MQHETEIRLAWILKRQFRKVGKRAKAPTNKQAWSFKFTIHTVLIPVFTIVISEKSFLILHTHLGKEIQGQEKLLALIKVSRFLAGRTWLHIIHFQSRVKIKTTAFYSFRFKLINIYTSHPSFFWAIPSIIILAYKWKQCIMNQL